MKECIIDFFLLVTGKYAYADLRCGIVIPFTHKRTIISKYRNNISRSSIAFLVTQLVGKNPWMTIHYAVTCFFTKEKFSHAQNYIFHPISGCLNSCQKLKFIVLPDKTSYICMKAKCTCLTCLLP